jgi:hypothetical protein
VAQGDRARGVDLVVADAEVGRGVHFEGRPCLDPGAVDRAARGGGRGRELLAMTPRRSISSCKSTLPPRGAAVKTAPLSQSKNTGESVTRDLTRKAPCGTQSSRMNTSVPRVSHGPSRLRY